MNTMKVTARTRRPDALSFSKLSHVWNDLPKKTPVSAEDIRYAINKTLPPSNQVPVRKNYRNQCIYRMLHLLRVRGYAKEVPRVGKRRFYIKLKNVKLNGKTKRGPYEKRIKSTAIQSDLIKLVNLHDEIGALIKIYNSTTSLNEEANRIVSRITKEFKNIS